jgi:hypothetical protein
MEGSMRAAHRHWLANTALCYSPAMNFFSLVFALIAAMLLLVLLLVYFAAVEGNDPRTTPVAQFARRATILPTPVPP